MSKNGHTIVQRTLILMVFQMVLGEDKSTVCYDGYGCFSSLANESQWPHPLPQDPVKINTKIFCYSRESTKRYNITLQPDISLNGYPLNVSCPTAVVVHGYLENGSTSTWMNTLKDCYLKQVVCGNVCLVDWAFGAFQLNYFQAAANTRIVGVVVAKFITYLIKNYSLNLDMVHFIGFSLGAQAVSFASNNLNSSVGKITALDPAQPGFDGADPAHRLDASDANCVVTIHSSSVITVPCWGFGFIEPIGGVDFYLNGGSYQPGCSLSPTKLTDDVLTSDKFADGFGAYVGCSHFRSYEVFISALCDNCTFVGHKTSYSDSQVLEKCLIPVFRTSQHVSTCTPETCNVIGIRSNCSNKGVFDVNTTSTSPYCKKSKCSRHSSITSELLHSLLSIESW